MHKVITTYKGIHIYQNWNDTYFTSKDTSLSIEKFPDVLQWIDNSFKRGYSLDISILESYYSQVNFLHN